MTAAFTVVVAHVLRVLELLRVELALFEAVELVVLQHCGLLDHRLVRLREEVVLFDGVLAWRRHFSQISLQKVTFQAFLLAVGDARYRVLLYLLVARAP